MDKHFSRNLLIREVHWNRHFDGGRIQCNSFILFYLFLDYEIFQTEKYKGQYTEHP